MEQRFFKVRLPTGRVIGPLDLERIKLFIFRNKITGLEMARLYPTGDWKDINTYPEIADLLMLKLEGKLVVDEAKVEAADEVEDPAPPAQAEAPPPAPTASGVTIDAAPPPPPASTLTGTPLLDATSVNVAPPEDVSVGDGDSDSEATMVMTANDERTIVYTPDDRQNAGIVPVAVDKDLVALDQSSNDAAPNSFLSNEKTAMLTSPVPSKPDPAAVGGARKKKLMGIVIILCALVYLTTDDTAKNVPEEAPFRVELPTLLSPDPQKSEKLFAEAMKIYSQDSVDGYKRAARLLLKATALDQNNVRSICMLASSYMNLIDVVTRDENYFNVVTRLIEAERAKGLDFAETVIADVELYHILGNPDAAFNRIVDYSTRHPDWGGDMLYYLALSLYLKGQYAEALQNLNRIDAKQFFSPKVPYLYGLLFERNENLDEAIKAYQAVINMSPNHIKARVKLAEIYFHKDNLPESGKHADFVIHHQQFASRPELARSYYFRARMRQVNANPEVQQSALSDLELALKSSPEDEDILLEYYTLKSKLGGTVKDAQGKAKMFHFLAQGQKALKEGKLEAATADFISARDANYNDPAPLVLLAEVFRRKGDLLSARDNYEKAVKLSPKKADLYPKYIKTLVELYEFDTASASLTLYKELNPPSSTVDRLQGDYYFKQNKFNEAAAYYKHALSSSNVDSGVYVSYATMLFRVNDFRNAAFYYGLAQRFDPFNVDATVGIGKSLSEIESLEKGVEYVQGQLQLSPHKAALLNGIAEIYNRKGDYAAAVKFADNSLVADPTFTLAIRTKADALASQDKKKEAQDAYRTYTSLVPLDPIGHIERYKLYMKKDEKGVFDIKGAKEEIEKVIKAYPRYPGAFLLLGDLYREGLNYESALKAVQVEIQNNPSSVDAYVLECQILNLNKNFPLALSEINKALKLAPNYTKALVQGAIANHGLKSYAAALSMLERALVQDSADPQIHKRLAILHNELGNQEKKRQHCKAYLDLFPDAQDRADVERTLCN